MTKRKNDRLTSVDISSLRSRLAYVAMCKLYTITIKGTRYDK